MHFYHDPFADGRWNAVAGYTQVRAHIRAGDLGQCQHFVLVNGNWEQNFMNLKTEEICNYFSMGIKKKLFLSLAFTFLFLFEAQNLRKVEQ